MGWVPDDCLAGAAGSASSIHGGATLSARKLTYLFVILFGFSRVISAKGKHVCFADAQAHGRGLSSVKCLASATTYGCLSYDIHAKFVAPRRASARVDSRGPVVDSVLIAGHAGTAAAVRGSARGSALRRSVTADARPPRRPAPRLLSPDSSRSSLSIRPPGPPARSRSRAARCGFRPRTRGAQSGCPSAGMEAGAGGGPNGCIGASATAGAFSYVITARTPPAPGAAPGPSPALRSS